MAEVHQLTLPNHFISALPLPISAS